MNKLLITSLISAFILSVSCKDRSKTSVEDQSAGNKSVNTTASAYNLNSPQKFNMPDELLEISGITFKNGDPSLVYAEQDEDGNVYRIKPGEQKTTLTSFAKAGDYEDIALSGNYVVILRSDGKLYTFPFAELGKPTASNVKEFKKLVPEGGEYESLFADGNKLYLVAKHSAEGKQRKTSDGYILNIDDNGSIVPAGSFSVDVKQIDEQSGAKKTDFRPSALAQHPLTHEWYIVSSVNKLLVVADGSWNVKKVYKLSNPAFLQPEGIAFDKDGNLYISNEGDKITPGTILKFKYNKQGA